MVELNIRLTVLVVETARLERRGVSDTWNRKEWGESKIEREQIKSERWSVAKRGLWRES